MSGKPFNMVGPADYRFWELLNGVVQNEPTYSVDATTLGFWASVGIAKGKTFAPDEHMKKTQKEKTGLARAYHLAARQAGPKVRIILHAVPIQDIAENRSNFTRLRAIPSRTRIAFDVIGAAGRST